MTKRKEDDEFPCHWPGCFTSRKGRRKPRGWAHCGYTMCCPEHAPALNGADLKIEDGWSCGPSHSIATIGYEALSEKGEAFLGAFMQAAEDEIIVSGSILPEDVETFKRMAAAAGVRLLDWTKPGGSPGLRILAESFVLGFRQGAI